MNITVLTALAMLVSAPVFAQGQVEAVTREVGHVLLYVPVVRPE